MSVNLQYLTDDSGEKTAVLIPIRAYEQLMEDLQNLAAIADRRSEPTVSHEDSISEQ